MITGDVFEKDMQFSFSDVVRIDSTGFRVDTERSQTLKWPSHDVDANNVELFGDQQMSEICSFPDWNVKAGSLLSSTQSFMVRSAEADRNTSLAKGDQRT
jgi:hypothetical protein